MPGTHGGSQGCIHCRRRKIKCDRLQPICSRCRVANLSCGGYRDPFRNVHATPRPRDRQHQIELSPPTEWQISPRPGFDNDQVEVVLASGIPPYLSPEGIQDGICVSYTVQNMFRGNTKILNVVKIPYSRILSEEDPTRDALLAIAMSYHGRRHLCDSQQASAVQLYGQCLQRLQRVIDSDEAKLDSLPELVTLFVIFELFTGINNHSWVRHSLGLERIYALLGAEKVKSSDTLCALFTATRPLMIGANIYERLPSNFCSSEWTVADWPVGRMQSTQALLDIWTHIPGLSAGTYEAMERRDGKALAQIHTTAVSIQAQLDKWLIGYQETRGPRLLAPSWLPTHWQGDLGWQTVLVFQETEDAGDYLSYCTASNLVLRAALAVVQALGPKLKLDDGWNAEDLRNRIHRNAIDVCRCIEYMVADERRGAGIFHLMMPTTGAWQVLRKDTPEGIWLREAMRDIHGDVMDGWRSMQGILGNLYKSDTWL